MSIRQTWLTFEEARAWARSQGLSSETGWRIRRKQKLPSGIPTNPNRTYKTEWQGWPDFLGNDRSRYSKRDYWPYNKASEWAISCGIRDTRDWNMACKQGLVPFEIPSNPWLIYPEWISMPVFLGQNERRGRKRQWRTYVEAREWVRSAGIMNKADWEDLLGKDRIPSDIPTNPNVVYAGKGWTNWQEFLGLAVRGGASLTEDVLAYELSHFLEVDPTIRSISLPGGRRKRVDIVVPALNLLVEYDGWHWHRKLEEKDRIETEQLQAVGWFVLRIRELPLHPLGSLDILVDPSWTLFKKSLLLLRHLLNNGFIDKGSTTDIDDYEASDTLFAASSNLANVASWASLEEARTWVHEQGITSESQWRKIRRAGGLPRNIPSNPNTVYAVRWHSWGDFFGTGREAIRSVDLVDYETARQWAMTSGITQAREWTQANKAGKIPPGIPGSPSNVYAKEWLGWRMFLGLPVQRWRPFEEARDWAHALASEHGIDSESLWRVYLKTNQIPPDVPRAPSRAYKEKWKGWGDWFGTGNDVGGAARWKKLRAQKVKPT